MSADLNAGLLRDSDYSIDSDDDEPGMLYGFFSNPLKYVSDVIYGSNTEEAKGSTSNPLQNPEPLKGDSVGSNKVDSRMTLLMVSGDGRRVREMVNHIGDARLLAFKQAHMALKNDLEKDVLSPGEKSTCLVLMEHFAAEFEKQLGRVTEVHLATPFRASTPRINPPPPGTLALTVLRSILHLPVYMHT
jgi:hypothetical protein